MNEIPRSREFSRRVSLALAGSIVLKHTDRFTQGIPDTSVTWARVTSWWEHKILRDDKIQGREVQNEMMRRLERCGLAHYVLFAPSFTTIVKPSAIVDGRLVSKEIEVLKGWEDTVEFVRALHVQHAPRF